MSISSTTATMTIAPSVASGSLLGEMEGSGYREPPGLVRRGDGQVVQLTPLLYLVLSAVDGRRTIDEVAAQVSEVYGRSVTGDNVRTLLAQRLRPAGLLVGEDGYLRVAPDDPPRHLAVHVGLRPPRGRMHADHALAPT
jgi:hypothetical protein